MTGKTQAVLDQQLRPLAKDSATAVEQLASLQCRLSLKGVAKKLVTDLAGKTRAVLPLSTYSEAVPRSRRTSSHTGGLLEVEGGGVALQSCASAAWLMHEWPPTAQCSW